MTFMPPSLGSFHRESCFSEIATYAPEWLARRLVSRELTPHATSAADPVDLATLTGDVRLTRGSTQLNGDRAEVNMDTGVSRLFTTKDGQRRVRGVITPDDVSGEEGEG